MNTKIPLKQFWISSFLALLIAFSNCQPWLRAEESNFTDEQTVQEALAEIERLEDKIDDLIDIINEAVPYGEEPFQFMDDGTYLNGNDTAWLCMNTIFYSLEDIGEIEDALNEYNPMILQFPDGI